MAGSTIGIKIADGSYYPVLEDDFTGTKRLTLTTVKDGQNRVQIDLYRGEGRTLDRATYVGSLTIENIPPAPQGEPEIELILGIDADGELTAEASDRSTGESQVFTTGIRRLAEGETYEAPEFEVETEAPEAEAAAEAETGGGLERKAGTAEERGTFDEVPLTGDAYPVSGADRRRTALHHRAPAARPARRAVTVLLVVLAVVLFAALGYLVYRLVCGPPIPPLWPSGSPTAGTTGAAAEPSAAGTSAGATAAGASAAGTTAAASGDQSTGTQPAGHGDSAPSAGGSTTAGSAATGGASAGTAAASGKGVSYRIKRGDTLWDISSTYYRNPWLYPIIAKANGIQNPDLIIAGARLFIPER